MPPAEAVYPTFFMLSSASARACNCDTVKSPNALAALGSSSGTLPLGSFLNPAASFLISCNALSNALTWSSLASATRCLPRSPTKPSYSLSRRVSSRATPVRLHYLWLVSTSAICGGSSRALSRRGTSSAAAARSRTRSSLSHKLAALLSRARSSARTEPQSTRLGRVNIAGSIDLAQCGGIPYVCLRLRCVPHGKTLAPR